MSLFSLGQNTFFAAQRLLQTAGVFATKLPQWLALEAENSLAAAALLREIFEELGASYIKLGQLIASTPGVFPPHYVREMQRCLDQTKPIPFSEMEKIISQEFAGGERDIFSEIEETPLASASIAQVHAARLKNGQEVVLKIQKPGIEEIITADMNLMYLASLIFEKLFASRNLGLTEMVHVLQQTTAEELDFIREGQNLREFGDFLKKLGEERVCVPYLYEQYSTRRILTMERLYGYPITDLDTLGRFSKDPRETLILALNTWTLSLFHCGFFHADVHAGNLLILEDGRLAFIDFGIVGRMESKTWLSLVKLVKALGEEDYHMLATSLIDLGATKHDINKDDFAKELATIFWDFRQAEIKINETGALRDDEVNELMLKLAELSTKNGLKIPRGFMLLLKQMLYFNRYIQILAPDLTFSSSPELAFSQLHLKDSFS
ncbi:MAG: AarF/UbiB family protein [Leptospiraceae bacterium]|nr:AarF/UbiB family protein [Leptospiraceae bacterium]